MAPRIIVDIDENGDVKIEADGVTGSGCQELTADLEKALGAVEQDVKKPEFHQGAARAAVRRNQLKQ